MTHKNELYGKQEGNCNGCLIHYPFWDMVVEGGHGGIGNLQLLGGGYNLSKRDGTQEYLIVWLKKNRECMLAGRRVEIGLGQTVACWKKLKQI